jgi:uncharacterized repeat protein (TIGR01451 family)
MFRTDFNVRVGVFGAIGMMAICLAMTIPATAEATASLRLYPDEADGGGGQLVTESPFTLNIANEGHGNGDNIVYDTQLVVSVADPSLLDTIMISDGNGIDVTLAEADFAVVGTPEFPCDGRPMPPHGIFPAAFTLVDLGDIEAGQTVALSVIYEGDEGLSVHFDAFGEGVKNNGDCRDIYNPFGHDVTAIVEGDGEPPPPDCEVEIEKTSDVDEVEIGDEAVFTITVSNSGDCELTTVSITDFIPFVSDGVDDFPAFTVIGTDPEGTVTITDVTWDVGTLAIGDTVNVTMTVLFNEELAEGHEIINAACVTTDQTDEECDSIGIDVGVVDEPDSFGGPGFWCRQIRAAMDGLNNSWFTVDELELWLGQINDASQVFSELRPVETLDQARLLLCRPNLLDNAAERLMRHLMTLWFNIASERIDPELTLGELCAGDEPLPEGAVPEWTVGYVLARAETELVAGADDEVLSFWKDVIDFVNNSAPPESCEKTSSISGFRW